MSSKVSAAAITAHSKRKRLQRQYQIGRKGKSPTGLNNPSFVLLNRPIMNLDPYVLQLTTLLLYKRWSMTNQTRADNPKVVETWIPLSYEETRLNCGWTRRHFQHAKKIAMNQKLLNVRYENGGTCSFFQVDEKVIETWVEHNRPVVILNKNPTINTLYENVEGMPLNVDSTVGPTLYENVYTPEEEEQPMKRVGTKRLERIDRNSRGTNNIKPENLNPNNNKTVIQSYPNTSVFELDSITSGRAQRNQPGVSSGKSSNTLGLVSSDNSSQINQIVVAWGKMENGISHKMGTQVYTRTSKMLDNLLQGKYIRQRKDGEPPQPIAEFFEECIIPQELRKPKWTVEGIISTLRVASEYLTSPMALDTVLWNDAKRFSRFLVAATVGPLEDSMYARLATRLHNDVSGFNSTPIFLLTLQLKKFHMSFTNGHSLAAEVFENVITWWIENLYEEFIPQAHSMTELRKKWGKIWYAKQRKTGKDPAAKIYTGPYQSERACWDMWKTLEATQHPTPEQIRKAMPSTTIMFNVEWDYHPPRNGAPGYFTRWDVPVRLQDVEPEYQKYLQMEV